MSVYLEQEEDYESFKERLLKEVNEYLKARKPSLVDTREKTVLTRNQRKQQNREINGIQYGVDNVRFKMELKKDRDFVEQWRKKQKLDTARRRGKITKIEGPAIGWLMYHCTVDDVPDDLPFCYDEENERDVAYHEGMVKILREKRVEWFTEGKFSIAFPSDYFGLDKSIIERARELAENEYHARYPPEVDEEGGESMRWKNIIQGFPDFWLTVFLSHPGLCKLLNEEDREVFKYLEYIYVKDLKDLECGYSINFTFWPNPYFEDSKLVKVYRLFEDDTTSISCTQPRWKDGTDFTHGIIEQAGMKKPLVEDSVFRWLLGTDQKGSSVGFHDEIADIFKNELCLWPNPMKYIKFRDD